MSQWCQDGGGHDVPDGEMMCLLHMSELQPHPPAAAADDRPPVFMEQEPAPTQAKPASAVCPACGTPVAHPSNTQCLNPDCGADLHAGGGLEIAFPGGRIEVRPGQSVTLGRHGAFATVFQRHDNVSRKHAVVHVEADGAAWVEPNPEAPNGTFVNGVEVKVHRQALRDRDRLRLAKDVEATVTTLNSQGPTR